MLTETSYSVPFEIIDQALKELPTIPEIKSDSDLSKLTINRPTETFCYDPWIIKDEFKGTVWETIYNSLPLDKGEARIIKLEPLSGYYSHADIDDRWHLNLSGEQSYLADLDNKKLYPTVYDGKWYNMNAGRLHTATNFGRFSRVQLVVRQLLKHSNLEDSVRISVRPKSTNGHWRYEFDNAIGPWLNYANKMGIIDNFKFGGSHAIFDIEKEAVYIIKGLLDDSQFDVRTI